VPSQSESETLRAALVAAFRPYLLRVLDERGIPASALDDVIPEVEERLDRELTALLALPFPAQPRGPLEVFQEAMVLLTEALLAAGVDQPRRDEAAVAALPGDLYDLAPASSQALGEEVWEAHIRWGAAKAGAFRPTVGLLSRDLMDRSKIEPVVGAAGFRLILWRGRPDLAAGFTPPAVAFVDLAHPEADEVIELLVGVGVRVIGFGPHVDDFAMGRARSLGAYDAMPRSVFFRTLGRLLPKPV